MRFIPEFQYGILNGWLFLVIYLIVFGIVITQVSKEVRARLYDRSLWKKKQQTLTAIGKFMSLGNMILFIMSPLQFSTPFFYIGLILWLLGVVGLVIALINFNNTPLDIPVTAGFYKLSRNPQIFSIWIIFLGICFMIGSGLSLLVMLVSVFFLHNVVIAEEEACLQQYGESYREFMEKVPRYFVFF